MKRSNFVIVSIFIITSILISCGDPEIMNGSNLSSDEDYISFGLGTYMLTNVVEYSSHVAEEPISGITGGYYDESCETCNFEFNNFDLTSLGIGFLDFEKDASVVINGTHTREYISGKATKPTYIFQNELDITLTVQDGATTSIYTVKIKMLEGEDTISFIEFKVNDKSFSEETVKTVWEQLIEIPKVEVTIVYNNGDANYTYEITSGSIISAPLDDPIKDGYRFMGWESEGQPFTFNQTVDSDITIEAVFAPVMTISFDSNGGTSLVSNEHSLVGSSYLIIDKNVTKEGEKLIGWLYDGIVYKIGDSISNLPSFDITLTAQWEPFEKAVNPVISRTYGMNKIRITEPNEAYNYDSATVYYTLNGDEPTRESLEAKTEGYGSSTIIIGLDNDTTIKARTFAADRAPSDISELYVEVKPGYIFYDCDADNGDEDDGADGYSSDKDGWRYLLTSENDMPGVYIFGYYRSAPDTVSLWVTGRDWCNSDPRDPDGTQLGVGAGYANTQLLYQAMGEITYSQASPSAEQTPVYAAKAVSNYSIFYNGKTYSSWFLPSTGEMERMYKNIFKKGLGTYSNGSYYWTSVEPAGFGQLNVSVGWRFPDASNNIDRDVLCLIRPVMRFND